MKVLALGFATILFQIVTITAQTSKIDKLRLIHLPPNTGLVLTNYQPDSPLKFEGIELYVTEDGTIPKLRYVVKNQSVKGIRFFSISFFKKYNIRDWNVYGISKGLEIGRSDGSGPVLLSAGERFSNLEEKEFEIVPMNPKVDSLLKMPGSSYEPRIVWIGTVNKVVFEDGSIYEDNRFSQGVIDMLW